MTATEKRKFVRDLMASVQKTILANVNAMPDDWDGHELRRYIADKFAESAMTVGRDKSYGKRFRAYKNTLIVNNL